MGKADIDLYGEDINLRKEAHDAFVEMRKAALTDGIDIKIVSSYRSFDRQAAIFERKYLKYTDDGMEPLDAVEKIIEYSTIPGTSRHHWGTDVDLIDGSPRVDGDVLVAILDTVFLKAPGALGPPGRVIAKGLPGACVEGRVEVGASVRSRVKARAGAKVETIAAAWDGAWNGSWVVARARARVQARAGARVWS